tara:strand:- start:8301 stop:8750 length:450 start_codon:yes stop_codon:yes gene_type:complete
MDSPSVNKECCEQLIALIHQHGGCCTTIVHEEHDYYTIDNHVTKYALDFVAGDKKYRIIHHVDQLIGSDVLTLRCVLPSLWSTRMYVNFNGERIWALRAKQMYDEMVGSLMLHPESFKLQTASDLPVDQFMETLQCLFATPSTLTKAAK